MAEKNDRNLALANERVENAKQRLAKCLNMLEITTEELRWACEDQGWDSMVVYGIDEAAVKLGYALATLIRWDEPVEQ